MYDDVSAPGILPPGSLAPQPNFGTVPNAGVNLAGATALTFWARGERGGERIEFFMGGVGRDASSGVPTTPFPDSTPRRPGAGTLFTLTSQWQKITIDLAGLDLHYVLGGFGWVASRRDNPGGAIFYLDDIQYELDPARRTQRLAEPRFLRSFTTLPVQPDPFDADRTDDIDFVLRNTAYAYDNAVALLAFLAEQGAIDTGNNAWAMIALLALYRRTQDSTYLNTARTLGQFIRTLRNDTGQYQGFQGGVNDPESTGPTRRTYASVEHNLDVFAAFTAMFQITNEPQWQADAQHARQFVEEMWDASRGCYLAGTTDPSTRNTVAGQLPEDTTRMVFGSRAPRTWRWRTPLPGGMSRPNRFASS